MAKRIEEMRLIDADALKEHVKKFMSVFAKYDWREICEMLNDAPTVEPKHSHWVIERGETVMHCNSCGWAFEYYGGLEEEWNYCPHCGAKMDERREDGKTD